MTLINRLTELSSQLDTVKAKSGGEEAARVYGELVSKISMYDEVEENKNRRLFLEENGVAVKSLKNDASKVSTLAKKILERFEETPEHTTLTRTTNFTRVIEELEKYNRIQENSLKNDWKEHCDSMFTEFSPDNVQVAIPNTPDNEKPLIAWGTAHTNYLNISREVPSDPCAIVRVQEASIKLKEIHSQFNRDVPPDVTNFMNGIKGGSATLELLTPAVLEYLREKALLNKYLVSTRNMAYGPRDG